MYDVLCFSSTDYDGALFSQCHNFVDLFEILKEGHLQNQVTLKLNIQHTHLKPRLRNYQKLGVQWMLTRERYGQEERAPITGMKRIIKVFALSEIPVNSNLFIKLFSPVTYCAEKLHCLYEAVTTSDGKQLYYNKYAG